MVILMSLSMSKLIIFVVIFLVCNNQVECDSNCHLSLYLISIAHAKSSKQYMSTSRREFFSPFLKVLILIPREFFKKVFKDDGFTSYIEMGNYLFNENIYLNRTTENFAKNELHMPYNLRRRQHSCHLLTIFIHSQFCYLTRSHLQLRKREIWVQDYARAKNKASVYIPILLKLKAVKFKLKPHKLSQEILKSLHVLYFWSLSFTLYIKRKRFS